MLYEAHVQEYRRRRAERLWGRWDACTVRWLRRGWVRAYLAESDLLMEMLDRR